MNTKSKLFSTNRESDCAIRRHNTPGFSVFAFIVPSKNMLLGIYFFEQRFEIRESDEEFHGWIIVAVTYQSDFEAGLAKNFCGFTQKG